MNNNTLSPRFGLFHWFGYNMQVRPCMELIRSAGFESVMLWWGDEYEAMNGPKEMIPETARSCGLAVDNVHVPYEHCNELWLDTLSGEELTAMYMRSIDDCAEHGIPAAVIHVTSGNAPPPPALIGLERMKRVSERAERRGVNLALENLRKPEYIDYIYEHIDSGRLKFCYDSGHENCYSKGIDLLHKHAARLCALHLHDNDGTADQHLLPGDGAVDWAHIKTALTEANYRGNITLEVTNEFSPIYRDMPADKFLALAYSKAVTLLGDTLSIEI